MIVEPTNKFKKTEALLFDLGGVIIEIDFDQAFLHWAEHSRLSIEELRNKFTMDSAYQQHERGELDRSEYFKHLRQKLLLDGNDELIAIGWNAIFGKQIEETVNCIKSIQLQLPCYAFTNTNPTHQSFWTAAYPDLTTVFDRIFVSSILGLRKPERAAFNAVAQTIGVATSAICFFDDTLENVRGAQAAGLQAVHVQSSLDVKNTLMQWLP